MKEDITKTFDIDAAGGPTGHILSVAGEHREKEQCMEKGDYAVVIGTENIDGNSVICGVAELGEYEYSKTGVNGTGIHPYQRKAKYLYDDGPVKRKNLSERFQSGEDNSIHLAGTRQRWRKGNKEAMEELVIELKKAKTEKWGTNNYQEKLINSCFENNKEKLEKAIGENIKEVEPEHYLSEERDYRTDLYCILDDSILIVEIKSGEAGESALEQLEKYVERNNDIRDEKSRGVIIAKKFSEDIEEKASKKENISGLYKYEFDGTLNRQASL